MVFSDFRFKAIVRIVLLCAILIAAIYFFFVNENWLLATLLAIVAFIQSYELYYFVSQTNRKLTRFLESIKYSDFVSGFSSGNTLGQSFKDLNTSFNDVLDAFRQARSEKEEHWQYLNTVVEHVKVGVISFDKEGNVGLINATAKKLLVLDKLRNIEELIESNSWLYKALFDLPPGKSTLFKSQQDLQLSMNATEIRLGDIHYKLVAIQNIQPELQRKEIEAWQNLTRILRHEIMNSIAPIASLTSTMKDIINEDAEREENYYRINSASVSDLQEGLSTIEGRSKGLIKFINAYRDYTSIPLPDIKVVEIGELVDRVAKLMNVEFKKHKIVYEENIKVKGQNVEVDVEQIGQVLINLVKNSIEAVADVATPKIKITTGIDEEHNPYISVEDNGRGIIREAMDKIFIPFFTTKNEGSGIGLALSSQIMQLHHGTIHVESDGESFSRFTLRF